MLIALLVVVGVIAAAHTAPFPFLLEAFRPSQSLWRVKASGGPPTVYLTFDDGPNPRWTPSLLNVLQESGVHATFFLIEDHITDETAPIVRRIADEGHAIALHSGDRWLMLDSPDAIARRLSSFAQRIQRITDREPCRFFRPHGGWRSGSMYAGVRQAGYRLTGWSWGMWDWDWWHTRRGDRVGRRLARKAKAGDIVVVHDGHHKNPVADRRHAGETVRHLVPLLQARGFQFATLC